MLIFGFVVVVLFGIASNFKQIVEQHVRPVGLVVPVVVVCHQELPVTKRSALVTTT